MQVNGLRPVAADLEADVEAGRVLDLGYNFVDGVAKLIPFKPGKLVLVQNGELKELLMTRTPTKDVSGSNGRARISPSLEVGPAISNLHLVSSKKGLTRAALERDIGFRPTAPMRLDRLHLRLGVGGLSLATFTQMTPAPQAEEHAP